MSKCYDVLSDRQITLLLRALTFYGDICLNGADTGESRELDEIISYFKNYNAAFNPLDHEQSK